MSKTNTTAATATLSAPQPIGNGIHFAVDGETLVLTVPINRERARPSSTGKMLLAASTEGWLTVPGTDVRLSLMAGFKAS